MKEVAITLCGSETTIEFGLAKAGDFYEKAGVAAEKKWLYLDKDGDIDIPLLPDDRIIVHGGERIFAKDPNPTIGENPAVRHPITPTFNGGRLGLGLTKAKITGMELRCLDQDIAPNRLFADLIGTVDAFIQDEWVLVIQEQDCYITIPAGDDDAIDVGECAKNDRKPPKGQPFYLITIDGNKHKIPKPTMTGEDILGKVGKTFDDWTLNRKFRGGRRKPIEKDEEVDFSEPGIERFETVHKRAQQG